MIRPCGSEIYDAERHVTGQGHVLLLDPHNLAHYTRKDWERSACPILVGCRGKGVEISRPGWESELGAAGPEKSHGLKGMCRRLGLGVKEAERRLVEEGKAWARSENPPRPRDRNRLRLLAREWDREPSMNTLAPLVTELQRVGALEPGPIREVTMGKITEAMESLGLLRQNPGSDERRRRLERKEGPEAAELVMLELNRQGFCAKCGKAEEAEGVLPSLGARRHLESGREIRLCKACASLGELEYMERGINSHGGYLGTSGLYTGGVGEVSNFLGFPLVALHHLYHGSAGWGRDSWHWKGWDRWNREWHGWNGGGAGIYTNMNLVKAGRHPGRDVEDFYEWGYVGRLREAQDAWLQEHGGKALPYRFNPDEDRRRRGRGEGIEALHAQAREFERLGQEVPLELTARLFQAEHGSDSIVTYSSGKKKVKNTDWLRRQLHSSGGSRAGRLLPIRFVVRTLPSGKCYLRVELDGADRGVRGPSGEYLGTRACGTIHTHTFETLFQDCHVLWDWLQTPLFESQKLDWDGRVGVVGRRMHESTFGHPEGSWGGPDAECYQCGRRYWSGDPDASPHQPLCPTCYMGPRTNPDEGRRRRARVPGGEALLAQIRAAKQEGRELTPLEWLVDAYGEFDLRMDRAPVTPAGYTPSPGVLVARVRSRFEFDRVEPLAILSYRSDFGGQRTIRFSLHGFGPAAGGSRRWVSMRGGRIAPKEARDLIESKFAGLILGRGPDWIEVGYPDVEPYRQAWAPYVAWLRSMGGARERLPSEDQL